MLHPHPDLSLVVSRRVTAGVRGRGTPTDAGDLVVRSSLTGTVLRQEWVSVSGAGDSAAGNPSSGGQGGGRRVAPHVGNAAARFVVRGRWRRRQRWHRYKLTFRSAGTRTGQSRPRARRVAGRQASLCRGRPSLRRQGLIDGPAGNVTGFAFQSGESGGGGRTGLRAPSLGSGAGPSRGPRSGLPHSRGPAERGLLVLGVTDGGDNAVGGPRQQPGV